MVALYGFFLYGLGLFVAGIVVLLFFPGRRLTPANVFLFVVGGLTGMGMAGYVIYLNFFLRWSQQDCGAPGLAHNSIGRSRMRSRLGLPKDPFPRQNLNTNDRATSMLRI